MGREDRSTEVVDTGQDSRGGVGSPTEEMMVTTAYYRTSGAMVSCSASGVALIEER
jgi:hypothetical protein